MEKNSSEMNAFFLSWNNSNTEDVEVTLLAFCWLMVCGRFSSVVVGQLKTNLGRVIKTSFNLVVWL